MIWLIIAMAVWGILHSWLASFTFKGFLRRTYGDGFMRLYRLFYNLFAVISIAPVFYLMITMPDQPLYQVLLPWSTLMLAGQGIALLLLIVSVLQTDIFSFAGLRQLVEEEKKSELVTRGLYRFVRHPLYTFSLFILWFSPAMSLNSFVVYTALTVYTLIGIRFEERKLLREFGSDYAKYRSTTPMLIPGLKLGGNK